MAHSERSAATVLDRLVPTFQAMERHSTTIAASTDHVWAALTQVTVGELRLFRLLMGVRVLPGWLLGRPRARFDAEEPLLGWAVRFGFTILGEDTRRELVSAAVAWPWPGARTSPPSIRPATPRWRPTSDLLPSPAPGPPGSALRRGWPAPMPPRHAAKCSSYK